MNRLYIGVDIGTGGTGSPLAYAVVTDQGDLIKFASVTGPRVELWHQRSYLAVQLMAEACRRYVPSFKEFAWEQPPFVQHHQVHAKLCTVCGMVAFAMRNALGGAGGLALSPAEGKQALTGDHTAKKDAMIRAALQQFRVEVSEHEADAIGIALACRAKMKAGGR